MLIGGRYRMTSKIGTGGMGEVWLARDERLDRAVAIKRLLRDPSMPPSVHHRFDAEFRLLLTLQHEHIVQLFDRVDEKSEQHIVMELVDGTHLERLVHEQGHPLSAEIAVYIADCILEALDFMQAVVLDGVRANIVHRDITPQNILLSFGGAVLVSDFGVAKLKATWKDSTELPLFIGKRSYAPPEMYETGYVDHRMDLYAVGVLLYEMLSGHRAFPIDDPLKSRNRICKGELTPLRTLVPSISEELAVIVSTLMHRDPEARYQTAHAAREALLTAVPRAKLGKPALRELIMKRYGGSTRPTGLHFSVESYQAAARAARGGGEEGRPVPVAGEVATVPVRGPISAPDATTRQGASDGVIVSSHGVPQLVWEPPGKWVADAERPTSSPSLSERPSSRERLDRSQPTVVPPRPRRAMFVWGIAIGTVLSGALAFAIVAREPPRDTLASPPAAAARRTLPVEAVHTVVVDPPATEAVPASAPATRSTSAVARPTQNVAELGELSIETAQPATVTLDGVAIGTTPIRGYTLSPGRYALELTDAATGARSQHGLTMTTGRVRLHL